MRVLKPLLTLGSAIVLGLLAACSSLGIQPATNLQQQILYGYAGVTASLNTLAQATAAGTVSPAEAIRLNSSILVVKSELDQAITLVCGAPPPTSGAEAAGYCTHPTNAPSAPAIIATATSALTGISAYVTCKQQKGASCPLP